MAEGEHDLEETRAAAGKRHEPAEHRGSDADDGVKPVKAYRGFFPVVCGNEVEVSQGGGMLFIAKDELEIEQGGGQWMIGLRKLEVEQGGAVVMMAGRAEVKQGVIGLLVSGRTELKEGSRVLMTLPQAVAAGVAAGAVLGLVSLFARKRR
jgi:hypothetical protein